MGARQEPNLRKGSNTKLQSIHFGFYIKGFFASPGYLFRSPNHRSAPFKGSCASPEFQRTGVTAENSVEISAAPFHLIAQFFCMVNKEMRDRLNFNNQRRPLNHIRLCSYAPDG